MSLLTAVIECQPPPAPDNTTELSSGPYNLDDEIMYTCVYGWRHLSGDLNRTCLSTELFNGTAPVCQSRCNSVRTVTISFF